MKAVYIYIFFKYALAILAMYVMCSMTLLFQAVPTMINLQDLNNLELAIHKG